VVVLGANAVFGADDDVVAEFIAVAADVHEGNASTEAEEHIVVLRAVQSDLGPHNRWGVGFFFGGDEQAGLVILVDDGVVQAGVEAVALDVEDLFLERLGVDGLVDVR
jgi:hypothetical protein